MLGNDDVRYRRGNNVKVLLMEFGRGGILYF